MLVHLVSLFYLRGRIKFVIIQKNDAVSILLIGIRDSLHSTEGSGWFCNYLMTLDYHSYLVFI